MPGARQPAPQVTHTLDRSGNAMRPSAVFIGCLLLPSPVYAEVSDKIPDATWMWGWGFAGFLGCIVAIRFTPLWVGAGVSLLALFVSSGALSVVLHPVIGPEALAEQGSEYAMNAVLSLIHI